MYNICIIIKEKWYKMTKKITSAILLSALLLQLVACGGDAPSDDTTADTTTAPVETEPTRETTPDNLPELDFEGAKVTLVNDGDWRSAEEQTGDVVDDAVFAQMQAVEERLNIDFEYIGLGISQGQFATQMRTMVAAGDASYDVMFSGQCYMMPLAHEGLLRDLSSAQYLDYDQPWWMSDYMETIEYNDERYLLVGDFNTSMIGNMSSLYVNKRLFEDNYGSFDNFYEEIFDGKWTYDLMNKYVEGAFRDLNGNGYCDDDDIMGLATMNSSATEHFVFPAGLKLSERNSDGKVVLVTDQSRNVKIFEELYNLYYNNPGTNDATDAGKLEGIFVDLFSGGTILFYPHRIEAGMRFFRDMEDDYAIIPRPKLDEEQENYLSLVHDSFVTASIPATMPDDRLDMVCAVLEAMSAEATVRSSRPITRSRSRSSTLATTTRAR